MVECRIRLWRARRDRLRLVLGTPADAVNVADIDSDGRVPGAAGRGRFVRVERVDGYWCEVLANGGDPGDRAARLAPLLEKLVSAELETLDMGRELRDRYEEIELLYTISEVLGRTIRLDEAARKIAEEVSRVVGARRASILVYDERDRLLRPVAGYGIDVAAFQPIPIDDPVSIAAQVFRERRLIGFDPTADRPNPSRGSRGDYRGAAFLSVPVLYPAPGTAPRPIGVINLTDRDGADAFSQTDVKLVTAIANQIGAAIENARLVDRDLVQQGMRRELELAHDLQLKLLASPPLPSGGLDAYGRCMPAASVGGDFYHIVPLSKRRMGVMLGDVSSHGFAAALIMALVLSAAGIHAAAGLPPDDVLRRLLSSIGGELEKTDMYLTLFYGVADPVQARFTYSNAGLPHAFRVSRDGGTRRLDATSPPLGLDAPGTLLAAEVPWRTGQDILVLFSDGIADTRDSRGEKFGEKRVLSIARAHFASDARTIVDAVFDAVTAFDAGVADDRTVLVLKS